MALEAYGFLTVALGALLGLIAYEYGKIIKTNPNGKINLRILTLAPHLEALWFTAKLIMICGITVIFVGIFFLII